MNAGLPQNVSQTRTYGHLGIDLGEWFGKESLQTWDNANKLHITLEKAK